MVCALTLHVRALFRVLADLEVLLWDSLQVVWAQQVPHVLIVNLQVAGDETGHQEPRQSHSPLNARDIAGSHLPCYTTESTIHLSAECH